MWFFAVSRFLEQKRVKGVSAITLVQDHRAQVELNSVQLSQNPTGLMIVPSGKKKIFVCIFQWILRPFGSLLSGRGLWVSV